MRMRMLQVWLYRRRITSKEARRPTYNHQLRPINNLKVALLKWKWDNSSSVTMVRIHMIKRLAIVMPIMMIISLDLITETTNG